MFSFFCTIFHRAKKTIITIKSAKFKLRKMKNKSFLITIAIFIILGTIHVTCVGNTDKYTISVMVKGVNSGIIYLQKFKDNQWVKVDSGNLDQGAYKFIGNITMSEMWYLSMQNPKISVPVFVENSMIDVQIYPDDIDKSVVTGSFTHDIFKQYDISNELINKKLEVVYKEWKSAKESNDSVRMKRNESISIGLEKEGKQLMVFFSKTNNKTVVSPYIISRNIWQFELPELEDIYAKFDTSIKASSYSQFIKKRINILKRVAIGQFAPDFTMNDINGRPVLLSSLKAKVLLIDFWASWSGPTRAKKPNLRKLYQAYNKKGFDILGVSLDRDKAAWIKAISDDQLTWHHVSDLKYMQNEAAVKYGVRSIPFTLLLDKEGKIIAKNLTAEELTKKLTELLP